MSKMLEGDVIDTGKLSEEEKRGYYMAWVASGLSKSQFCREHGLPVDALHYWHRKYKGEVVNGPSFSRVMVKSQSVETLYESTIDVGMRLPNEVQLQMSMPARQLVVFIRELCDATAIVR